MINYKLKLKALFHDPFDKQYVIWELNKSHKLVAKEYFNYLFEEDLEEEEINIADQLASAISRIILLPTKNNLKKNLEDELKFKWEEIKYIDVFSSKIENVPKPKRGDEVIDFLKKLGSLNFINEDKRAELYFLFLWRFLPEIFPWINIHPADSRAPNHSIYDHLVQTSAIVSALKKPAFLLFTIGPVQEYITTARKISDLWAGSYILSYLTYKAIEVILEKLGPDNVIYPNLLGQPLVDKYLFEKFKASPIINVFEKEIWFKKFIDNSLLEERLLIANFPNRFLAIVPFEKAKEIAEECKEKIIKELENFVDQLDKVDGLKSISIDNNIKEVIKSQLKDYFQIYYVYLPWFHSDYKKEVKTILEEYKNLVGENEIYQLIEIINTYPYYEPNVGIAYSLLCELVERFLASRKMYRKYVSFKPQVLEKCHLCGGYDILEINWNILPREIVRERERLCGVCFIKRLFPKIIKELLELSEEISFPSTSEIATILYKKVMKEEDMKEFKEKFESFEKKLKEKHNIGIPKIKSVPALKDNLLYQIDGDWLFKENYRKEKFKRELGIDISEDDYKEILEIIEKLEKPPTYYAILMMDGDEMGKWLKGEKMPRISNLIHSKVVDILLKYTSEEEINKITKILSSSHPISASIHQSFSRKLTDFALNKVRKIIEEENYGKLIYAGGDDLLAFLPVEKTLDCAYSLQREFREILGENSSMSGGIVIAHHRYPLRLALNKTREAERKAKDEYNRNAFYIIYLSRGGEERGFGGKWEIKDFIDYLTSLFKTKKISKGFGFEFLESVEKIEDKEILEIELKRILRRKFNIKSESEKREIEENFLVMFERYQNNLKDFANMILIVEKIV